MALLTGKSKATSEICEALGLDPKKTTMLNIHIANNKIAVVTARIYTGEVEGGKLATILKRFRLEEREK